MKRLATWYTWALFLPVVLPLFFVQGTMYPLLAPKTFALRGLGIIVLALCIYLVLRGAPLFWHRLRRWETWIPGALLALAYLASLVGVDFYHSFWSTFERGDGLLTLTVCVGYFYLIVLSAEASWLPRLFRYTAVVGALSALYLVVQWIVVSLGADVPFIVKANGRIGGTMGNAAFLAAYLGMTLFATLAVAGASHAKAKRLFYAAAGLQLFAIVLTATRGTQLALLGVAVVALLSVAVKGSGRLLSIARSALALLAVTIALFVVFRAPLADAPFEPIRRLASISLTDSTVASRLFVWRAVSQEALSRPLIGYGGEHIDVPFDRIYDPSAMVEEWFDRSHNAYLDYFVQYGALGLVLYLVLGAVFLTTSWKLFRRGNRYGLFLAGIVGTSLIQNFFVFDTAVTLWLFLALFATALVASEGEQGAAVAVSAPRPVIGSVLPFALLLLLWPVVVQPLRANLLAFEAYQYQIVDVARAKEAFDRGTALGTYADLELGYNAYFMYTKEQITRLTGADLQLAYATAVQLLKHSFERYPYDVRTAVYLAQVLSLPAPGIQTDNALLSQALERSLRLSPKRAQPWFILANLSLGEANTHPARSAERIAGYTAAKDLLTRYIALVPKLSQPHFVLAQLELASGNAEAAAREAERGRVQYREDLETAKRAAAYYETVMDLPNAKYFLSEIVKLDPANDAARSDLETITSYEQSKK